MLQRLFSWFENRIDPYPDTAPPAPRKGLLPFIWSCLHGTRGWLLVLTILTIGSGILEALMFQFMGKLVDWMSQYTPAELWSEKSGLLLAMLVLGLLFRWMGMGK